MKKLTKVVIARIEYILPTQDGQAMDYTFFGIGTSMEWILEELYNYGVKPQNVRGRQIIHSCDAITHELLDKLLEQNYQEFLTKKQKVDEYSIKMEKEQKPLVKQPMGTKTGPTFSVLQ